MNTKIFDQWIELTLASAESWIKASLKRVLIYGQNQA